MATQECAIHPNFKKLLVDSNERATMVVQRSIDFPHRNLKNETTLQVAELEKGNPKLEDIFRMSAENGRRSAMTAGTPREVFSLAVKS